MYPIILWKDFMGIGQKKTADPTGEFFFAQDFPQRRLETTWDSFPSFFCCQPEEILPLPPPRKQLLSTDQVTHFPSYSSFEKTINLVQKNPTIRKVVLARRSSFTFTDKVDPIALFFALRTIPNTHPFAFILSPDSAFVGATPELLFRKEGLQLTTEALAGTRPIEKEEELLTSPKEQEEFTYVKEDLQHKLQQISLPFSLSPKIGIKKTNTLAHLHYPFNVTLKKELSDQELINHLHPTPAIAGTPQKESLTFLENHEPFDRGWYAGTIGYKKGSFTEVYIAIRSGLIQHNTLHLFTGAGILPSSSVENEWLELNYKLKSFKIAF